MFLMEARTRSDRTVFTKTLISRLHKKEDLAVSHRTNETKWGFRHRSNSHFRKGRLGNNQKRLLAMLHFFFATQKPVNFTWPCSPSPLSIWSMIRRPTWRWSRYNRDWNEEEETDFLEHHEPSYAHHQPFSFLFSQKVFSTFRRE